MSTTTVTYPIVAAIKGAEAIIGPDRQWRPVNPEQERFLAEFFADCKGEIDRLREIETKASWDASELNRFLKAKGFSITLEKFKKGEFGVASVLDLLVEWLAPGQKVPLTYKGTEYPGVRLKHGVEFYEAAGHKNPVAILQTKSGDTVCLTALPKAPKGFDLVSAAQQLAVAKQRTFGFDAVRFPMVDLNQTVDIDWLKGMQTKSSAGQGQKISQAKQQTKLRMNEKGARAQSAVAIGVVATSVRMPKPDLVIDRPFLVWFERAGLAKPLFVGHVTPDDWKAPADLETP